LPTLICLGLSHQSTPVEVRELVALNSHQQGELLLHVAAGQVLHVDEIVILSTCNRTEFYTFGEPELALPALKTAWSSYCSPASPNSLSYCFELLGEACISHLFRVAGGLESQLIGEAQILGQVTEAYERARQHNATGATLSALFQYAIQAGKRVRHQTALGQGSLSISSVAATHSQEVFGSLGSAKVLIIGAGEMARTAAAAFVRTGIDQLYVANHNHDHALEVAAQWGGEVVSFTNLADTLEQVDLVITAITAPHTLLHVNDIQRVLPNRKHGPLVIFDLGLPRNVEPEIAQLSGVKLFNLDDLQSVTNHHYTVRQNAIPEAEAILTEEIEQFELWQASRGAVPVIRNLRAKAEEIRQAELDLIMRRWPDLNNQERKLLEEFSQRLINKLLHEPTLALKAKSAEGDSDLFTSVVDTLFNLQVNLRADLGER
jgi:glutamyl-tRNA reductase